MSQKKMPLDLHFEKAKELIQQRIFNMPHAAWHRAKGWNVVWLRARIADLLMSNCSLAFRWSVLYLQKKLGGGAARFFM